MNGAVQEFETVGRAGFLPVWEQAPDQVRRQNTHLRLPAGITIPPRIRISEHVPAPTSPMRLRVALVPAWPGSPDRPKKAEFTSAVEPFAPKPRVWLRTSNPLRHGLRIANSLKSWTQPKNCYTVGQKLRPMDPLMPAAADPTMRFGGAVGQVRDLPMASETIFPALGEIGDVPHKLPLLQADVIPSKPGVVSLPGIMMPASPQPGFAFTQGFRPLFRNPNSYSRRLQPRPRLDICEQVTFPRALKPVSLGQTLKKSDTPADQQNEIYQLRHARHPA